MKMLLSALEICIVLIAVVLSMKEIIIPLFLDKPLFPMIRKTIHENKKED